MVVITIIAFLMGMLTFAGYSFVVSAKESATRATITKVDEAILERVSAINRWHQRANGATGQRRMEQDWANRGWPKKWGIPPAMSATPEMQDIMLTLSRKQSMIEAFPITPSELYQCYWFWGMFEADNSPGFTVAAETDERDLYLKQEGLMASDGTLLLNEPGEIFLYALKNAPVFGGLPMVADDFRESELIDPEEDGIPELGDAWGKSLRFYRWPTRLVKGNLAYDVPWADYVPRNMLMPNAPAGSLKQDPNDPVGEVAYRNLTSQFHDPFTWSAPLLVSAGPDGQLGLAEPTASVSVPVPSGATTFSCIGLAEPLSAQTTVPAEVQKYNEQLFDNITNHTIDGGL